MHPRNIAQTIQSIKRRDDAGEKMATTERRMPEGWHLKKEIQFGHIITTATVAVAALFYFTKIEQRIALVEQQIIVQHDRDDQQDKANGEALQLIRQQLEKMDAKLDRALERKL